MTQLSLICINAFPGIDHFMGLGQLAPLQLASLFPTRREVTQTALDLSREAWKAFCSSTPEAIEALLNTDTLALPFLKQALMRHLEEFPASHNGLSRTEKQVLEIVVAGIHKPAQLFRAEMEKEESVFMGDLSFWFFIAGLTEGSNPLLKLADGGAFSLPLAGKYEEGFLEQILEITDKGLAVLNGLADWIPLHDGIDRWLGGVHLRGQNGLWRWDVGMKRTRFA